MLPFLKYENLFILIIIFKIFILPPHQNFWLRRLRDFSSPERNNFGLGLLFIWGQTIERSLNWPWWVNVIHTHTRKGSLLKTYKARYLCFFFFSSFYRVNKKSQLVRELHRGIDNEGTIFEMQATRTKEETVNSATHPKKTIILS